MHNSCDEDATGISNGDFNGKNKNARVRQGTTALSVFACRLLLREFSEQEQSVRAESGFGRPLCFLSSLLLRIRQDDESVGRLSLPLGWP